MTTQLPLVQVIEKMQPQIDAALRGGPTPMPADRFIRVLRTTIQTTPEIGNMDRSAVLACIMRAAQDGLVIDGKEAAIVPFKGKPTYIPMVAGLVKKIRQHSKFAHLTYGIVYQKEIDQGRFEYIKGDEEYLKHDPILFGERGDAVGAYAIVTTDDGHKFRAVLRKDQIEHRLSKGQQGGAKTEWWQEFWIKTAIKAVYKIAPNSGDEAGYLDGVIRDDDIGSDDGVVPFTEPPPATTPQEEAPKPQTRAAAAIKAVAPKKPIEDAEIVPEEYTPPDWSGDDDNMPL